MVWDVKELQNTYLPLPTIIKGPHTKPERLRGQRTEGVELGSPAVAWRDGVVEAVVAAPRRHRAGSGSRLMPRSCTVTCPGAIPAAPLSLRSPRLVGPSPWPSAPWEPWRGAHRITVVGLLRGDVLSSNVFSCAYQYVSLQHFFHSCMHYIKQNKITAILCITSSVAIWRFL